MRPYIRDLMQPPTYTWSFVERGGPRPSRTYRFHRRENAKMAYREASGKEVRL